jgi:hypothetical protein
MAHKPFVTYLEYEESFEGVIWLWLKK